MSKWYRVDLLDSQGNTIAQIQDLTSIAVGKSQAIDLLYDTEYANDAFKVELLEVDEDDVPIECVWDKRKKPNFDGEE